MFKLFVKTLYGLEITATYVVALVALAPILYFFAALFLQSYLFDVLYWTFLATLLLPAMGFGLAILGGVGLLVGLFLKTAIAPYCSRRMLLVHSAINIVLGLAAIYHIYALSRS